MTHRKVFRQPDIEVSCFGTISYRKRKCDSCREVEECKIATFFIPQASLKQLPQYLASPNKELRVRTAKRLAQIRLQRSGVFRTINSKNSTV